MTASVADIIAFGRAHVASGDIDPTYPVLRHIVRSWALTPDEALWLTNLYVAYYHLPSALMAFRMQPNPRLALPEEALTLPCGTERRGHRSPKALAAHLDAYRRATYPSQTGYWCEGLTEDRTRNFAIVYRQALQLHGNGRWAAFKLADLYLHALDMPLDFPSMFLEESSGPRAGLALLYPEAAAGRLGPWALILRNAFAASGLPLSWDQLETVLCDFHSLAADRYYVGHDIDEMQARAFDTDLTVTELELVLEARRASFPPAYLGEAGGWRGVDKERNRAYRTTGQILLRD